MLGVRCHILGSAQYVDDDVDDMAAQFKHHSTRVFSVPDSVGIVNDFAHHAMNFERVAQKPLSNEIFHQDDPGIVAIHVPHLDAQMSPGRGIENSTKLSQRFSSGL